MHVDSLRRIRIAMIVQSILGFQTFLAPVIILFYLKYLGVPFATIAMLEALNFILAGLWEIPSGYIADRFGRKRVYILAYLATGTAMLGMVAIPSVSGLILYTAISSFSVPLASGNLDSLYYEAYEKAGRIEELTKLYGTCGAYALVSGAVAAVVGGLMAKAWLPAPIVLDAVMIYVSAVTVAFWIDDDQWYCASRPPVALRALFSSRFSGVVDAARRHTPAFVFFLIPATLFAVSRGSFEFYQLYLDFLGIDVAWFGVLFGAMSLFSAGVSFMAGRVLSQRTAEWGVLILLELVTVVSFVLLVAGGTSLWGILGLFAQQIVRGLQRPFFGVRSHSYISPDSTIRTTLISVLNFLTLSLTAASIGLSGLLFKWFSVSTAIALFGTVLCTALALAIILHRYTQMRAASPKAAARTAGV